MSGGLVTILTTWVTSCVGFSPHGQGPAMTPYEGGTFLSSSEARAEARGTLFVVDLENGTRITGRYEGKSRSLDGHIAMRDWDGHVRQVGIDKIKSIEAFHTTRSDLFGELIMVTVLVGFGTFLFLNFGLHGWE